VIISQRVTNVIDCDEIIVLEAGKITARGDSQTVYQNFPILSPIGGYAIRRWPPCK
jgi:ABC-type multidrug transport system fused ATPase/permease subunit